MVFGLLGGLALIAMELLMLPSGLGDEVLLEIGVHIVPQWTVTGIGLAFLALLVESRMQFWGMAFVLLAYACAMSAAFAGVRFLVRAAGLVAHSGLLAALSSPLPTFLYDTWVILFFGSMFLSACVLNIRAERTRSLLERCEIERGRAETMLSEAQLRTLRGHVDPAFLLLVMNEVARRYAAAPAAADRLLARFVEFLRHAMPGVREGISTLDAELALVRACNLVRSDLDPQSVRWSIRSDEPVPKVPFPPLLLLPMIDRWVATGPAAATGELAITCDSETVELTLKGATSVLGDWLPPELAYRLRVGLRKTWGERWHLTIRDTMARGAPALSLMLQLAAPRTTALDKETLNERT